MTDEIRTTDEGNRADEKRTVAKPIRSNGSTVREVASADTLELEEGDSETMSIIADQEAQDKSRPETDVVLSINGGVPEIKNDEMVRSIENSTVDGVADASPSTVPLQQPETPLVKLESDQIDETNATKPEETKATVKNEQNTEKTSKTNPESPHYRGNEVIESKPQNAGDQAKWSLLSKLAIVTKTFRRERKYQRILKLLEKKSEITMRDVVWELRVSNATAVRYLDELEKRGHLRQVGTSGPAVHYVKR